MIVILDESLWTEGAVDPLELLALVAVCAKRRHTLLLDPRSRQQAKSWIDTHLHPGGLRQRVLQILKENERRSPNASSHNAQLRVVAGPTDWERARLKPTHAVRLLQRPLKLLVENSRNDGAFLRLMAEPSDRRQLDGALRQGWIEFEMGGGIPELKHRVRLLANAAHNDDTAMIERARLWIMFDRDAHPDDRSNESDDSREVRECALRIMTPWPLAAHQLERRAIENYVPSRTLRDWWCGQADTPKQKQDREQQVDAFLRDEENGGLSARARRHFNMKNGLLRDVGKKRREELSHGGPALTDADLDQLFRGLDPMVRDRLQAGGGFDGLSEAFSDPSAINENALVEEVQTDERRRLLGSLLSRM